MVNKAAPVRVDLPVGTVDTVPRAHGRDHKLVQPLWKTVWQFLRMLNIELPCDPAIPLLGRYPREMKTCPHKNSYVNVHSITIPRSGNNQMSISG